MAHGNAIRLMAYDAGRLHHISSRLWNEEGSYFLPEMHDSHASVDDGVAPGGPGCKGIDPYGRLSWWTMEACRFMRIGFHHCELL